MKEVTFLDRVPTNPGRVVLTPVPGQANTFDMVRADNPLVEGTPLDKATFDSVVHSRLTGRYYLPTVSQTVVSSKTGITANPIPKSGWTDVTATGAKSGAFTITASGSALDSATPDKATDGNANTEWRSNTKTASGVELWWQFYSEMPLTIKKVKLKAATDEESPRTVKIKGSTDGNSWADLLTVDIGRDSNLVERTLTNTGDYQYYRISFDTFLSQYVRIYEFEVSDYDVKTYANAFTVAGGWPMLWTEGQRATIQIPASVSTLAVVSNTINGIPCNTVLQPGRRYELRYVNSAFAAKEV